MDIEKESLDELLEELKSPNCLNFEDLPLGTLYKVGSIFTTSGKTAHVMPFQFEGPWRQNGTAGIGTGGKTRERGQEIQLNAVNLGFDFDRPVGSLVFSFSDKGGAINMAVNGVLVVVANLMDLNNKTVDKFTVHIAAAGGPEKRRGRVSLTGDGAVMELFTFSAGGKRCEAHFVIGGNELFIDRVCPTYVRKD